MRPGPRAAWPRCKANSASPRSPACSAASTCRARRSRTPRKCWAMPRRRPSREEQLVALEIVLITGMSGSGKSVALRALEDAGYYCVDNLPPELLLSFVALEQQSGAERVAIAMDVRSATSLPLVPRQLRELSNQGVKVRPLFLDAT